VKNQHQFGKVIQVNAREQKEKGEEKRPPIIIPAFFLWGGGGGRKRGEKGRQDHSCICLPLNDRNSNSFVGRLVCLAMRKGNGGGGERGRNLKLFFRVRNEKGKNQPRLF